MKEQDQVPRASIFMLDERKLRSTGDVQVERRRDKPLKRLQNKIT